ncbi:MAG: hypothetical protein U0573_05970 [Phycisphaerales bacterium]
MLIALVAMLAVATYLVGHAEVARKSAELEALRISQAKEKQTVENAMLFTNLTTKYLRSLSEETPGASWLNLIGFTESMMKQRFPIDASQMNGLWDQRIVVAEDLIKKMGAAGKRTGLESLMIETSLVVWLLREGRANDALVHLNFVDPCWRKMVAPDDEWLQHLVVYRACADVLRVDPKAPDAEAQRVMHYQRAQAEARKIEEPGTTIVKLLTKIKPASLQ